MNGILVMTTFTVYCSSVCTGSCVLRGFRGCCVSDSEPCVGACSTNSHVCYCDQVCHRLVDCCPDILEIGCFSGGLLNTQKATHM